MALAAVLACCILSAVGAGCGSYRRAVETIDDGPQFQEARAVTSPDPLTAAGGTVRVEVGITTSPRRLRLDTSAAGGPAASLVELATGELATRVPLSRVRDMNRWAGELVVPANPTSEPCSYRVLVSALTTEGRPGMSPADLGTIIVPTAR
jgi:hypothetical protein